MFLLKQFIIYTIYCVIIIPIGITVSIKLYKNISKESHKEKGKVIQRIMKTYAFLQCFTWPCLMVWYGILHVNSEMKFFPESWMRNIIFLTRFILILHTDYVSFNSLIIALCRYIFLIFERHAEAFGINKMRKYFITGSVAIPIIRAIFHQCTVPIEDNFIEVFTPSKNEFFQNYSYTGVSENQGDSPKSIESALYVFVNTYLPPLLIDIMKLTSTIMVVMFYTNIFEGIIYAHTFVYSRR